MQKIHWTENIPGSPPLWQIVAWLVVFLVVRIFFDLAQRVLGTIWGGISVAPLLVIVGVSCRRFVSPKLSKSNSSSET